MKRGKGGGEPSLHPNFCLDECLRLSVSVAGGAEQDDGEEHGGGDEGDAGLQSHDAQVPETHHARTGGC